MFSSIPIFSGSKQEDFFEWIKCIETACLHSAWDFKMEMLGRGGGGVSDCLMGNTSRLTMVNLEEGT